MVGGCAIGPLCCGDRETTPLSGPRSAAAQSAQCRALSTCDVGMHLEHDGRSRSRRLLRVRRVAVVARDCLRARAGNHRGVASMHGTRSRYTTGCRCDACRAANAEYGARYQRDRRRPDGAGLRRVQAMDTARRLTALRTMGYSYGAIARATGIPPRTLADVHDGRSRRTSPEVRATVLTLFRHAVGRRTGGRRSEAVEHPDQDEADR